MKKGALKLSCPGGLYGRKPTRNGRSYFIPFHCKLKSRLFICLLNTQF